MSPRTLMLLAALLLPLVPAAPVSGADNWGPFQGQFVDVETGEPIAEVAVLVTWWQNIPNPVQGHERFYDAREAVSDAHGRFEVPRRRPPLVTVPGFDVLPFRVNWFAPGYKPVGTIVTPPDGEPFLAATVVQMRRLRTRRERISYQRFFPPAVPFSRMSKLLEAINRERGNLGLKPIGR